MMIHDGKTINLDEPARGTKYVGPEYVVEDPYTLTVSDNRTFNIQADARLTDGERFHLMDRALTMRAEGRAAPRQTGLSLGKLPVPALLLISLGAVFLGLDFLVRLFYTQLGAIGLALLVGAVIFMALGRKD